MKRNKHRLPDPQLEYSFNLDTPATLRKTKEVIWA
jgi:hypothetical protein